MKAVRILVLAALAAMLTTLGMGNAAAAPTPTSVPGVCATAYPVDVTCQAHIFTSTNTPAPGQTIEASGKGYQPDEDVALTIGGIAVGTAHTDSNGDFDPPVVVPAQLTGDQPLTGAGASGKPYDIDSVVLHIQASGVNSSSSGGGLASTGVDILTGVAVALALIGAGVLFARGGRRRHSHH